MTGRRRKRRRSKRRKRMRVEGEGKDGKEEKRGGRSICGSRWSSRRRGGRSIFLLRIRLSMGVHYGPHVTACSANKNRKSNKNFRLPNANKKARDCHVQKCIFLAFTETVGGIEYTNYYLYYRFGDWRTKK